MFENRDLYPVSLRKPNTVRFTSPRIHDTGNDGFAQIVIPSNRVGPVLFLDIILNTAQRVFSKMFDANPDQIVVEGFLDGTTSLVYLKPLSDLLDLMEVVDTFFDFSPPSAVARLHINVAKGDECSNLGFEDIARPVELGLEPAVPEFFHGKLESQALISSACPKIKPGILGNGNVFAH